MRVDIPIDDRSRLCAGSVAKRSRFVCRWVGGVGRGVVLVCGFVGTLSGRVVGVWFSKWSGAIWPNAILKLKFGMKFRYGNVSIFILEISN